MTALKTKKETEQKQYLLIIRGKGTSFTTEPAIEPREIKNDYGLDLFVHKLPIWSATQILGGEDKKPDAKADKYCYAVSERNTGYAITKKYNTRKAAVSDALKIVEDFGIEKFISFVASKHKIV